MPCFPPSLHSPTRMAFTDSVSYSLASLLHSKGFSDSFSSATRTGLQVIWYNLNAMVIHTKDATLKLMSPKAENWPGTRPKVWAGDSRLSLLCMQPIQIHSLASHMIPWALPGVDSWIQSQQWSPEHCWMWPIKQTKAKPTEDWSASICDFWESSFVWNPGLL